MSSAKVRPNLLFVLKYSSPVHSARKRLLEVLKVNNVKTKLISMLQFKDPLNIGYYNLNIATE